MNDVERFERDVNAVGKMLNDLKREMVDGDDAMSQAVLHVFKAVREVETAVHGDKPPKAVRMKQRIMLLGLAKRLSMIAGGVPKRRRRLRGCSVG
jgi:hypothetical protein